MKLTLDTSCVIHGSQDQAFARPVNELVDLARAGLIGIWLTSAFDDDQRRASAENRRTNFDWIRARPVLREVPGPFRPDYSFLDGKDILLDDESAQIAGVIERIVLPPKLHPGALDVNNPTQMTRWRKRVTDVQHLIAHAMAGHDLFVTTDSADILSKRERLLAEAAIEVADPGDALLCVRDSVGSPERHGTEPGVGAKPPRCRSSSVDTRTDR